MSEALISAPVPFAGKRRVTVPAGHRVLLFVDEVPTKVLEPGRRDFWGGDIPGRIGKSRLSYALIDIRNRSWTVKLGAARTRDGWLTDVSAVVSARLSTDFDWRSEWDRSDLVNYVPDRDIAEALNPVAKHVMSKQDYADLEAGGADATAWADGAGRTAGLVVIDRVQTVEYGRDPRKDELDTLSHTTRVTSLKNEAARVEKWRDDQGVIDLARSLDIAPALLHTETKDQVLATMRMRLKEDKYKRKLTVDALQALLNGSPFALAELTDFAESAPNALRQILGIGDAPPGPSVLDAPGVRRRESNVIDVPESAAEVAEVRALPSAPGVRRRSPRQ